jgi:hypothetical protein
MFFSEIKNKKKNNNKLYKTKAKKGDQYNNKKNAKL